MEKTTVFFLQSKSKVKNYLLLYRQIGQGCTAVTLRQTAVHLLYGDANEALANIEFVADVGFSTGLVRPKTQIMEPKFAYGCW